MLVLPSPGPGTEAKGVLFIERSGEVKKKGGRSPRKQAALVALQMQCLELQGTKWGFSKVGFPEERDFHCALAGLVPTTHCSRD